MVSAEHVWKYKRAAGEAFPDCCILLYSLQIHNIDKWERALQKVWICISVWKLTELKLFQWKIGKETGPLQVEQKVLMAAQSKN